MNARHRFTAALVTAALALAAKLAHRTEEARALVAPTARDVVEAIHDPDLPTGPVATVYQAQPGEGNGTD
jgi:hypothetical protein